MKLIIALILAVPLAAAAQAQGGTGSGQPVYSAPGEAPAQPSELKPAQPSEEKPALPSKEKPALPSGLKPAQPSEEKPAQPSEEKPAQSGIITERVDSTPEILQAPENPFFRPFHGITEQQETPAKLQKNITTDKKSGKRRLYNVSELKKMHSAEIKELRKSLKKRPNSEIREAVKTREAGQKAELKSLQEAILTEAEKDQTGSPQPKPENQIIQIEKAE